jgi:hypothetical protein
VGNWDVGIGSVGDLIISRWRGKLRASARSIVYVHGGLRWRCQDDSDILIPDVWVK